MKTYKPIIDCKICKGKCCKSYAGAVLPQELGRITLKKLIMLFKTGNYAIDWYEGDPRPGKTELFQAYFIRPRHKNTKKLKDPSWGGECIFLTKKGCKLDFNKRPFGCRAIKPEKNKDCDGPVDKAYASIAWLPYTNLIEKAIIAVSRK